MTKWCYVDEVPAGVGMDFADVMLENGLAKSKSEVRRKIQAGALKINDQKINDPYARLTYDGDNFVVVQRMEYIP